MRKLLVSCLLCCGLYFTPGAQPFESAVQYLDHINKASSDLTAKYLYYISAVGHGKSARKVEKRRVEVVNMIIDTRFKVMGMPAWKGDRTLRDTTVAYLKILSIVFNEDYAKIVNMEEIAEQSYDGMEAYLLAQEKAQEKLAEASKKQQEQQRVFAAKNDIKLVDGPETEQEAKSRIVDELMDHCNAAYLVFFKCHKQEAYLMEAVSQKNLVSIEQNINALKKFAEEGLDKLKEMKGYNNDGSLIVATRNMMHYYKESAGKGPVITDYFLKEEEFNKIKKQFESKPASKRTQQDVDQYNKSVNDINKVLNTFNSTMADVNKKGKTALNDWNKTYSKYMDEYMPKQGKQ